MEQNRALRLEIRRLRTSTNYQAWGLTSLVVGQPSLLYVEALISMIRGPVKMNETLLEAFELLVPYVAFQCMDGSSCSHLGNLRFVLLVTPETI